MSTPTPQQDPDLIALVQACRTHLRHADTSELQRAFEPPRRGERGEAATPEQLHVVYETACRLCEEGNYRFATALALHLAAYCPTEPRFSFIAGTCLHHLGAHANAVKFYCIALANGGDNPAALYRLGECLLALGDKANAERALDVAFEVARDVEGAAPLQTMAQTLLDSLRKSPGPRLPPGVDRRGVQG
jgi:tetratricopeptide (TPR) repeat protein